jgi:hypothetical protein
VREEAAKLREQGRARSEDPDGHLVIGMAGGSSGPDLLFHEACQGEGLPSRLYLALPKDHYVGKYVAESGPAWVERFHEAYTRIRASRQGSLMEGGADLEDPVHVLSDTDELPRWLQGVENYSIGRRTEIWMLQHALVQRAVFGPDTEVTLIVLWSPSRALTGGLCHLVELARRNGVKVVTIDCGHWGEDAPPKADAASASR